MSGVFGGTKKSSSTSKEVSDTSVDTDSLQSQWSDALTSAVSSGFERSLSNLFGSSSTSGTNTNTSNTGFQNTGAGTSNSTSTRNPWEFASPVLQQALQRLSGANDAALDPMQAAARGGVDYASAAFGGVPNMNLGDTTAALSKILGGGATGAAGESGGAAKIALDRMLSGTPDYAGVQGAIDAANAPILRQLEQDIIPGLNSRATFLNNPTGGIKTLNRVLPEVGARMSENATAITDAERRRALSDQAAGLGIYGSLSGQSNAQALQAAGLAPELLKMGLLPSQLEGEAAGLPLQLAERFASSSLPFANVGGSDTTSGTTTSTGTGTQVGQSTGTSTSDTTTQQSQESQSQNFQQQLQQAIQEMLGQSSSSQVGHAEATGTKTSKEKSGGLGSLLGGLVTIGTMLSPGGAFAGLLGGGGAAAAAGSGFLAGPGSAVMGGSAIPGLRLA